MSIREFFEGRAQALAIPFTHATTTGELGAQVRAHETREMGTLEVPGCFGQMWEGPFGPDCAGCAAQAICLHEFVLRELPHVVRELNTDNPVALAERLQVDPRAIELAWQYIEGSAPSPRRKKPPAAKSARPKASPPPPPTRSLESPTLPPPPSASPSPPASAATAKAAARPPVAAPASAAAAPDAPSQNTSPTPSRPPPPIPTRGPTPPSTPAPSSSPRAKKPPKTTPATPTTTTAPADKIASPRLTRRDPGFVPWGRHTHEARFLRERQRSELLATLRPGQTIRRTYKGQEVEVRVGEGCYLYRGVQYATLYQIVKEVTGPKEYPRAGGRKTRQITNWSATRFFGPAVEELLTCW